MSISKRPIFISKAAAAIGIAALINVWMQASHPLSKVPTANLDTGELWRALSAVEKDQATNKTAAPQVLLLGSSLIVAPVMQAEANYLNAPVERMNHRRSTFLESEFAGEKRPQVYCMAVGGEMASDAYLIARHLLNGPNKPDAIVYGIAPRDVQDNLLPGAESTEAFKTLAAPDDVAYVLTTKRHKFLTSMEVILSQAVPLWRYRGDIEKYVCLRTKKTIEYAMPYVVWDKLGPDGIIKPQHKGQFPEEVKGNVVARPGQALDHSTPQNTDFEYQRRYLPINPVLVNQQFGYLDKLIKLCRDRGVALTIVNMPLSSKNLALLPDGFYSKFKARVKALCEKNDTDLVDMCNDKYMSSQLYADGVHLESAVSQKFLQALVDRLQSCKIASALGRNL